MISYLLTFQMTSGFNRRYFMVKSRYKEKRSRNLNLRFKKFKLSGWALLGQVDWKFCVIIESL